MGSSGRIITSADLLDGTIMDADINAAAGIGLAKLFHVGSGNVFKSNGTNNAPGKIVDADVAAAGTANIAINKLLHIGPGVIIRSDGSQNVAGKLQGGDITATTIDAGKLVGGGAGTANRVAYTDGTNVGWTKVNDGLIDVGTLSANRLVNESISTAQIQNGTIIASDLALNAVAHVSLNYNHASDLQAAFPSPGSWVVVTPTPLFNVQDAQANLLILVRGGFFYASPTVGAVAALRVLIQNATIYGPIGSGYVSTANVSVNIMGGVNGMLIPPMGGAGDYQISLQMYASHNGTYNCRPAGAGNQEFLNISVLELKR